MDGNQFRVSMHRSSVCLIILMLSNSVFAQTESLDLAFLEWLGETAELEELGVDIEQLIQNKEDSVPNSEENTQ